MVTTRTIKEEFLAGSRDQNLENLLLEAEDNKLTFRPGYHEPGFTIDLRHWDLIEKFVRKVRR